MHSIEFFQRKNFLLLKHWAVCGGLCLVLSACSSLNLAGPRKNFSPPPYEAKDSSQTSEETQTLIHASYRQPSPANPVIDLPDAQNYSIDNKRTPVDKLNTAPEWTQTPEDTPPTPFQDRVEPMEPLEMDEKRTQTFQPRTLQETDDLDSLPWIDDMSRASLKEAIRNQLAVMEKTDLTQRVRLGARRVSRQHLVDTLYVFLDLLEMDIPEEEFNRRLNEEFEVIPAGYHRAGHPVMFTGYYTPIIPARREKTEDFIFPLYQKPDWYPESEAAVLNDRRTYHIDPGFHLTQINNRSLLTRKDIDGGQALSNQHLELAWLRDDLERYFLHIQGSGYLAFPDGTLQAVQYMGSNHFPYHSVGKQMIRDGVIEPSQGSMQGMKQYFREHPENINHYLFRNNRYIFFQNSNSSPRGSGGAELVGGRSIATDKSLYPAGGLVFITVEKPLLNDELEITGWQKVSRFVVDQDTGSAIKGPGRVDLYFGIGEPAGAAAGHYKRTGTMSYLVKK